MPVGLTGLVLRGSPLGPLEDRQEGGSPGIHEDIDLIPGMPVFSRWTGTGKAECKVGDRYGHWHALWYAL